MKHTIILIALALGCFLTVRAQGPKLPAGYMFAADADAETQAVRADLDRDKVTDLFAAAQVTGAGEDLRLIAVLKGGRIVRKSGPLSMCCGSLSQKGGVVDVHSRGMRGFTYYKFRWDAAAADFRLIGYDTESFGNAANDGSGTSSLNLLTGAYEAAYNTRNVRTGKLVALPKVKRKIPVGRRIYLSSFDDAADEWLAGLSYKYKPAAVR